ncbi:uncharacterized protein TNCV_1360071 [Trichonephila clavipes]|nr:uncharacterized protein TNCV_1360071 [Trichonephila clavipes]
MAFCRKLSLVTKHGVSILYRKAIVRASRGNVRLHDLQRNQKTCTPVMVRSGCPFLTTTPHYVSWNGESPSMPSVIKPFYRTFEEPSNRNTHASCPMTLFSWMIIPSHTWPMWLRRPYSGFDGTRWIITVQSRPFTV